MLKHFIYIFICIISLQSFSQEVDASKVYDQIYLKNGKVLTGTIILFQESDGDITFKDTEGRTYSITRKEYKYFREHVVFISEDKKDTTVLIKRKVNQYGLTVGNYTGSHISDFSSSDFFPFFFVLSLFITDKDTI